MKNAPIHPQIHKAPMLYKHAKQLPRSTSPISDYQPEAKDPPSTPPLPNPIHGRQTKQQIPHKMIATPIVKAT